MLRVAEEAADGLFIVGPDGRFAFVNRAALDLFGYQDEAELLGRKSHDTTHYKHRDGSPYPVEECPLLQGVRAGERVRVDDDWFVRRDGTMIAVAYIAAPFETEAGIGSVVAIRDMTELRRAEAELRLLQTATLLLTSSEELEDGVMALIRAVCEQTGWTAGEMWAPHEGALWRQPGWWAATPAQEAFFLAGPALAPGEGLHGAVWTSKRPVWVDIAAGELTGPRGEAARAAGFAVALGLPVLAEQEVVAVLGFFADRARPDDQRWTDSLAAIAAQLGPVLLRKRAEDLLARQAGELARSNEQLRGFAELLAHELHQPVAAIARADDLATARASARRLQESIDGLLRYASAGRPRAERVELSVALDQALEELELGDANLVRHPLPAVQADAAQIRAVLRNLLSNALRYRGDAPLEIEVGARTGRGEVVVFVRDNGRGIEPAAQERIFELGRRGTSAPGGAGLGLAVSRRIVEAYGGRIWVESKPGRGATFLFALPFG